jgi:hypothetical protein
LLLGDAFYVIQHQALLFFIIDMCLFTLIKLSFFSKKSNMSMNMKEGGEKRGGGGCLIATKYNFYCDATKEKRNF